MFDATRNDILGVPIDDSLRIEGHCSRQSIAVQVEIYGHFVMHLPGNGGVRDKKSKHLRLKLEALLAP
jgi:hypothetical protein